MPEYCRGIEEFEIKQRTEWKEGELVLKNSDSLYATIV